LLRDLRAHGVDTEKIAEDPDNPLGVTIILLDSQHQNYIIAAYGANAACDGDQVEAADPLLLQLEIPFEASLQTAQQARSKGVAVVWGPAPARELPLDLYESVDLFMTNQVEATALTGVKVTDVPSARSASDVLRSGGVPVVVVKLGGDGAFYTSPQAAAAMHRPTT